MFFLRLWFILFFLNFNRNSGRKRERVRVREREVGGRKEGNEGSVGE